MDNTYKTFNSNEGYPVKEIADKVFMINEFGLSTMFLIEGDQSAAVIDCGTGVCDFLSTVKSLTAKPFRLLITHAHVDHIGGRGQFDTMALGESDLQIIDDVTVKFRKQYVALLKLTGGVKETNNTKFCITKPTEPTAQILAEGDVIDLGGRTLEVFETPAHTNGSLMYLLMPDNILFSGDVLNPLNLMMLKAASPLDVMKATLLKAKRLAEGKTIWASHLEIPLNIAVVNNALSLLDKLLKRKNCILNLPSLAHNKNFTLIYKRGQIHSK